MLSKLDAAPTQGGSAAVHRSELGFRFAAPGLRGDRADRVRRSRARRLSGADRGDHLRADARRLCLGRPAADVPPLELRQAFRVSRDALPQGAAGSRLRDRHQLEPVHLLHHGRKLHDDADAGASRTPRSATIISSRTTTCSGNGPMPTAFSITSLLPATTCTKCEERYGLEAVERVLDAAHALKEHGVNRYAHRSKPNLAEERQRAEDRRAHIEERPTTICGAPFRTLERTSEDPTRTRRPRRRSCKRQARPARGKPALFHRETGAAARRLAARADPHRAQCLAVLLSAEAAADDERRLRDLRALRDHEPAARPAG